MASTLARDVTVTATVTDPSDWATTALPHLAPLDAAFRCQICKDYYTTPMVTPCNHTFCSLCIRRYLSKTGTCPSCRAGIQEVYIKKNHAVEELVEAFKTARGQLMEVAQREVSGSSSQEVEQNSQEIEDVDGNAVRRSAKRKGKRKVREPSVDNSDGEYQDGIAARSTFPSTKPSSSTHSAEKAEEREDGFRCPICHNLFDTERAVQIHIGVCVNSPTKPTAVPPKPAPADTRQLRSSQGSSATAAIRPTPFAAPAQAVIESREHLPKLFYTHMTEKVLRSKLRDLGIPNSGVKKTLEERHKEWVSIWNADCDSKVHRPKKELLRELRSREKAHEQVPGQGNLFVAAAASERGTADKAEADVEWRESYSAKHNDSFQGLVKQARERMKRKVMPDENASTKEAVELQKAPAVILKENAPLPLPIPDEIPATDDEGDDSFEDEKHAPPSSQRFLPPDSPWRDRTKDLKGVEVVGRTLFTQERESSKRKADALGSDDEILEAMRKR